jgi:hypothetical protein
MLRCLSLLLALSFAACDERPVRPGAPPALGASAIHVAAGTGGIDESAVDRIRAVVVEQLPALSAIFRGMPNRPVFVHVHATREALPPALRANLHEGSSGFALLGRNQIHLVWGEMRRTGAHMRGVVVHELVHVLLDQYVQPQGARMPRWFHEGLAQSLAGDTYLGAREEDLVWRAAASRLPSFGELRERFPTDEEGLRIAYAQSYSYVEFLRRQFGLDGLLRIAAAVDEWTTFERALVGRAGRSTLELEDAWKNHLLSGSGASWRVMFEQCWSLLLIAALPVLALALIRRLAVDRRARERLERENAAAETAAPQDELPEPAPEDSPDPRRDW